MNESIKRIDFIAGYISAYEEKIKLLNASGLLSEAKLFELFAINVGGLYLGQGLSNLNIDTYAYPCVDLISDDGQIYIQVSTAKNIPTKVKETLEKIRDSSRSEIDSITSVKFIVLHNDSVDRVKDYTGENQIGKVPFIKANDLITTALIVQRVQDDLDFQIALYDLLSKEAKSIKCSSFKLKDAIENSKIIMSHSIDCKINKEYEIDRSEIISKINIDGHKNISIHGEAGSGKSVLCKKLVESEEKMLYARAEQFREATDINAIWGFNIKQTLEYLGESPIIFFIDSLEFIADVPTKWDLLLTFYEHTKMYPHAKIITTCRTSDKNAFIKIEGAYSVFSYVVEELTESELLLIANKYPIISNMNNTASYAKLLKSPFYLNLIISKITDFDNIADENELREYIWKYIICMDDLETKNVVESIVFTRAMKFSLGAITSNYDTKIIRKLISSNVLIENRNVIRLKYDIFEDICFEQYLDAKFDECRGKYDEFFSEIEGFGRCIYRRYQIWVENKLFAKSNREKFLNVLVFSKTMPQNWRKQTIIGLVKSRYCVQFFDDFGATISSAGIIGDFIKITNLYAFEVTPYSKEYLHVQLRPCGEGRQNLIHLVAQAELYKGDAVSQVDIEKLCSDYARAQTKEEQTAKTTSLILIYFLENHISESDSSKNYRLSKDIISMLKPIYQLANYSKEWIMSFWAELTTCYKGDNDNRHLAADIIEDTLKFEHVHLAKHLPAELCTLAEMFWTYSPVERYGHIDHGYDGDRDDITYLYGLSKKAKRYANNSNKGALYDSFFLILFKSNFWIGFDWAINFINNAVINFAKKQDEDLPLYEIYFIKDDFKKSYLGYPEMWLASTDEYRMPMIISDMIYCLKEVLYEFLKAEVLTNEEKNKFAKDVRKYIYEKSNNIALLTLIADIGMDFMIERPGFSLDLVTNIEIIQCDINRYFMRVKNPALKLLEQQIYKTVGIPSALMSGRYKTDNPSHLNLQVYVAYSQVYCDKNTKSMCYRVLDYLYSIITNDSDNAIAHLQIQKMDTRAAETIKIDDTISMLVPTVTGEAKKIVAEGEKKKQPENTITSIIYDCNEKLAKKGFTLSDCLETIERLMEAISDCPDPIIYSTPLIGLISFALNDTELDSNIRATFCQMWIDVIKDYFSSGSFVFECSHSTILFTQVTSDVCDDIKNQLKQLMLELILYNEQHGVILDVARFAKAYLSTNQQLAQAMFNTVVKLAEDEMDHQKFIVEYINKQNSGELFEFTPNIQSKFTQRYSHLIKSEKDRYEIKKNEIIGEYLLNGAKLSLPSFDLNNYDIVTFCRIVNCGLSLANTEFAEITKKLLIAMINAWKVRDRGHDSHRILNAYTLSDIYNYLHAEIMKGEAHTAITLDVMFDGIEFSKFTREAIKFYLDVFGFLPAEYFDAHSDKERRARCVGIIRSLEGKVKAIKEEDVKVELYKSLILSFIGYRCSGDWSKLVTSYSYQDKMILNNLFSTYGAFHLEEMLVTIYKFHIDKLLPEVLLSVRDALKNAIHSGTARLTKILSSDDAKYIVLRIISIAFFDYSAKIKKDDDLTHAFEEILEMLVNANSEEAATILDEFRIH